LSEYSVNIVGLSQKTHSFDFKIENAFFQKYGSEVVSEGRFVARVNLNKKETLIEADFDIEGKVNLICDRSLDPFEYPMKIHQRVIFKYGDAPEEVSDEIIIIPKDQQVLEVGQLMYEFILLNIPYKKIHPRFLKDEPESDDEEGTMIYQSEKSEDEIDPRWEKLKKLKK
jgi:uncharacterized protein